MSKYYFRHDFERDLDTFRDFMGRISRVGEELRLDVGQALRKNGLKAEILFVGSTNPKRLTTLIDPRTPDERYPSDFDVAIITQNDIPLGQRAPLLKKMFPNARSSEHDGREEIAFYKERFPVCLSIVPESEVELCPPVVYTRKHAHFDEDQIRQIRALRLFCMRNGLYGGYTRGVKGIALEQAVAQHGDFDQTLNWFDSQLQNDRTTRFEVNIPSPLDNSNVVGLVQNDIWVRMRDSIKLYLAKGKIKSTPYTIESWQEDHTDRLNLGLHSCLSDPHESYKIARDMLNDLIDRSRAGQYKGQQIGSSVLVIPCYKCAHVLISVKGLTRDMYDDFQRKIMAGWDKKMNSSNDTRH